MNKSELIDALSRKEKLTEKEATDVVNLIFAEFAKELKSGGRIEVRGFGSFGVREYGSYAGRNPKTGRSIEVSAKKLPFFKVSKGLRASVNSEK